MNSYLIIFSAVLFIFGFFLVIRYDSKSKDKDTSLERKWIFDLLWLIGLCTLPGAVSVFCFASGVKGHDMGMVFLFISLILGVPGVIIHLFHSPT